jgi:antitoxin (DNA-binding transcriptional repressor) of toxin-antitoxin stability system
MRTVNVHEDKTQFSRLIDAAHEGKTILVAKDGKPWARLVPLEIDRPRRQPGLLRGQLGEKRWHRGLGLASAADPCPAGGSGAASRCSAEINH